MRKKRDFRLNLPLVIIFGTIFVTMIVTMFFNTKLTYLLHLKPDLSAIKENALEVHFVDTGEGDITLIRLPNNKTVIVDSGTSLYNKKITTYINNAFFDGENGYFDYAILTHTDLDHMGNFLDILNSYDVKNFYRPKIYSANLEQDIEEGLHINNAKFDQILIKLNTLSKINNTKVMFTELGAENEEIKPYLKFLSPLKDSYEDENEYSPYILVTYKDKNILLTGDAPISNEIDFMNYYDSFDIDVLKVAHHGSKSSTSKEFVEFLKPEYAVISCGENSYGHPTQEVLNNLSNYSENLISNTYITQNDGNIVYYVNSSNSNGFLFIKNISSYIFIDYFYIAIGVMGICLIVVFFPKYKKEK